jgi:uncharacterized protein (TIGR02453 family)
LRVFTLDAIRFLRTLKRHNDREWFRARRDRYEALLRQPMIALIERLARDFRDFAPHLVADPRVSLYRIYRDTRFSEDKSPLKTHVAAVFPSRGLPRHEGPGLYVEIAGGWVWAGGGLYAPEPEQLQRVREHIAGALDRFRAIVEGRRFRTIAGTLNGERLSRVPRGFAKDHPAAEYLKHRQFLAGREWPAEFAASARFYPELVRLFRTLAPLVSFLYEPLRDCPRPPGAATIRKTFGGES